MQEKWAGIKLWATWDVTSMFPRRSRCTKYLIKEKCIKKQGFVLLWRTLKQIRCGKLLRSCLWSSHKVMQKFILIIIINSFICFLYSRVSFSSSDALLTCLSFDELRDNRKHFWCLCVCLFVCARQVWNVILDLSS